MVEPGNMSCYAYYKACTEEYGEYFCQQHLGKKFTNTRFLSDVDALAGFFRIELGLQPGDVYAVFMPTTVQSIAAFYALNKIGVTVNFIHPLLPPDMVEEILTSLHAKGVMLLDLLSRKHADYLNKLGIPCLVCHSSDYANLFAEYGIKAGEGVLKRAFPKLKNRDDYMKAVNRFRKSRVKDHCDPDAPAVLLNGGGTTGKAKTIKLSSRSINEIVFRMSKLDRIHRPGEDSEVIVLPLFHCFGLCVAVHMALCNSARIIPMMQFDAKIFNRLMRKNLVVGYGGIPLMFDKLMKEKHFDGPWLKNIRLMFCGGDDVRDEFLDEFNSYFEKWGAVGRIRQGYGLTEIGSVCCTNTNTDYRRGSIGRALRGVTVQIWDDDHNELPVGEIGEIAVSGPTIMSGYYTKDGPEDLGLYTDEEGRKWVLSGDLAYKDEDGYLFFSGRKKRVIIISGYNVYPADIEKCIGDLDFIKDCCAVQGWQGDRSIVRLYASLNKSGDEEEYKEIIRSKCLENFSKFYVPREILFIKDLPQTPLMKIDFMKLTQHKPDSPVYGKSSK